MDHLSEDLLGLGLIESFLLLNILEQVATLGVLHDHQEVLLRFKHLIEPDDVRMTNFAQNIDFLHYFLPRVGVLHVCLVDSLDGYVPPCQFMNRQRHFAKGPLTN